MKNSHLRMVSSSYAYDAQRSRAFGRDADPLPTGRRDVRREEGGDFGRDADQDAAINAVKIFLKNRLSPEDFSRLEAMLSGGGEEDDTGSNHEDPMPPKEPPTDAPGAQDRFKGASDARGSSYFDNFPGNARVDVWRYGD